TRKIGELAADLSASATDVQHPLLKQHEKISNSLLLVITSNRGLCGGYNSSIIREAMHRVQQNSKDGITLHLELSGKRAINYFKFQQIPAEATYTQFEDKVTFEEIDTLATRYIAAYAAHKLDRVEVAYMKFISSSRQAPVVETLLPLSEVAPTGVKKAAKAVEYEFLPSAKGILEEILPMSFKVRLFKCFLDAAVSEQIARRVAMKGATENAGEIIKQLTRKYNRARQSNITKEISEVIGGAAALE
ncbi:MAG TPA: ATP synthase F1 subunit gamma, partial [Gemmataceae bacterium]|nr:ATP synthase F1 subunit gamma [Gemmataceae bacterium]